jgi:hypothetical protein
MHYAMKTYRGVGTKIHVFMASALVGGEWTASRFCRFTPREITAGAHCMGGWMGPRPGLDDVKKSKYLTLYRIGIYLKSSGSAVGTADSHGLDN